MFFISGFSDIWSAIRKHSASELALLLKYGCFSCHQSQELLNELINQVTNEKIKTDWKKMEGFSLGLNVLVQFGHKTCCDNTIFDQSIVQNVEQTQLLHSSLLSFVQHEQLSVRKESINLFRTLLTSYDTTTHQKLFQKIINQHKYKTNNNSILSDYAIEGSLRLCTLLIDILPSTFLVHEWHEYWPVIEVYLEHKASIVRQVASSVCFHLVKRGSSTGTRTLMFNLICQSICSGWQINEATFENNTKISRITSNLSQLSSDVGALVHSAAPPAIENNYNYKQNNTEIAWEAMEGRMLAYELLLTELLANHTEMTQKDHAFSSLLSPMNRKKSSVSSGNDRRTFKRSKSLYAKKASSVMFSNDANDPTIKQAPKHEIQRRQTAIPGGTTLLSKLKSRSTENSPSKQNQNVSNNLANTIEQQVVCLKHQLHQNGSQINDESQSYIQQMKMLSDTQGMLTPPKFSPRIGDEFDCINEQSPTDEFIIEDISTETNSVRNNDIDHDDGEISQGIKNISNRISKPILNKTKTLTESTPKTKNRNFSAHNRARMQRHSQIHGDKDASSSDNSRPASAPKPQRFSDSQLTNDIELSQDQQLRYSVSKPKLPWTGSDLENCAYEKQLPLPATTNAETIANTNNTQCPTCLLEIRFKSFNLVSFTWILIQILLQATAAALSCRWELRRMADEVYPLVLKLLSWFDIDLLHKKCLLYLSRSTFLQFASLLSIKYMMRIMFELLKQSNNIGNYSNQIISKIDKILPVLCYEVTQCGEKSKNIRVGTLTVETLVIMHARIVNTATVTNISDIKQNRSQLRQILFIIKHLSLLCKSEKYFETLKWILTCIADFVPQFIVACTIEQQLQFIDLFLTLMNQQIQETMIIDENCQLTYIQTIENVFALSNNFQKSEYYDTIIQKLCFRMNHEHISIKQKEILLDMFSDGLMLSSKQMITIFDCFTQFIQNETQTVTQNDNDCNDNINDSETDTEKCSWDSWDDDTQDSAQNHLSTELISTCLHTIERNNPVVFKTTLAKCKKSVQDVINRLCMIA